METRQENVENLMGKIKVRNSINDKESIKSQINTQKERTIHKMAKRFIDIIFALLGVIVLIPLTIIVWLGNLMSKDNGPIFYVQKRIGKNGKLFKIYKYRTMVVGADKALRRYLKDNPEEAQEYEKYKKLKEDPRITKFGMLLRKTSLDEFPQFINVLKGEMSIVGPRPYLLKEKKDMGEYYNYIINCKPGLTCIWQVSGRSNLSFQERLDLDMEYINNQNLIMDFKLVIKTFTKIFKSEGAV